MYPEILAADPHDEPTKTLVDGPRRASQERLRERPEARPQPRAQPTMLGRYHVLSELGRGGMSVVYAAYDPELDRRVALKVVRAGQLSEQHRARLHREAQALARLSHPSVVTVFDVGDLSDDTFVAMELIEGESLRDWMKKPHTWREAVKVVVAAGRGLAAAHAAGIVHRDVKPDNIVISTSGVVKLVDFGLARDLGDKSIDSQDMMSEDPVVPPEETSMTASSSGSMGAARPLEAITQHGHIVGTPAYMPPEQRSRRPEADERSDQFSLCATLYEALYKQRPFKASKKDVLDRNEDMTIAQGKAGADTRTLAAPPPKDSDVPAWLHRVLMRGLAVDSRQRFPSVEALLKEIDRDPARTMKRVAAATGVLVGVAAIATIVTYKLTPSHAAQPSCGTGDDRVAQRWNPARRAELDKAAATRGGPGAQSAIGVFAARADAYAATWEAMFHDSCVATRIQHTQSEEALDLRMACLDKRLAGLGALVDVMKDADKDQLAKAGEAVDNLPDLSECADVQALRQIVKRPTDPGVAAKVTALDGDLARLSALYAVGDMAKTLALADHVIADARATNYAPSLAQALYWRGRAIADRDGGPDAIAMFDETFSAALGAGEDQMAADAAARIAQEDLWAAQLPDFERWERITHALAARTHAAGVARFIDQLGCMANHWRGKPRTRLACLRDLAARKDGLPPSEWLVTTLGVAASEAGEPAEAIHWLEQGVELARAENGADHPRTLEMRAYLCHGLNELGEYDRAAGECRHALARLQKVTPDDKTLTTRMQLYLGESAMALHHPDEARTLIDAAAQSDDEDIKMSAQADQVELAGKHGDPAAAVAEHKQALAETIKVFAPFNPHHPNIIAEHHELGKALLEAGDAKGALAELTTADTEADPTEISPLELAQIHFARAQALVKSKGDAVLAKKLASDALAIYGQHAPDTARFRDERDSIQKWLSAQ